MAKVLHRHSLLPPMLRGQLEPGAFQRAMCRLSASQRIAQKGGDVWILGE